MTKQAVVERLKNLKKAIPMKPKDTNPLDISNKNKDLLIAELTSQNSNLKIQVDALKDQMQNYVSELDKQNRANLIPKLKANTSLTDAQINAMDTQSLHELNETIGYIKQTSKVAGIRGDTSFHDPRLTVANRFKFGGNK